MTTDYPPFRKLRVPSNWCVHKTGFLDLSPDAEVKFKRFPHDDGWLSFEQDLLLIHYESRDYYLDMGWIPKVLAEGEYTVAEGQYVAHLVKGEGWETLEEVYAGRSLEEVTEATNRVLLRISVENGDYPNFPKGLQLQEFTPSNYARYVKNEFFDLKPDSDLSSEQWRLFKEEMLVMQSCLKDEWQVTAGWFPAFDPNGLYKVTVSLESLGEVLREVYESQSKAETVEYINNIFYLQLPKLYELHHKREKSDKERRRQARLRQQRDLQN